MDGRNGLERYGTIWTVRNDLERSENIGHGHVTVTSRFPLKTKDSLYSKSRFIFLTLLTQKMFCTIFKKIGFEKKITSDLINQINFCSKKLCFYRHHYRPSPFQTIPYHQSPFLTRLYFVGIYLQYQQKTLKSNNEIKVY